MMQGIDLQRITNRDLELLRERAWERASRSIWWQKWTPRLAFAGTIVVMIPVLIWLLR